MLFNQERFGMFIHYGIYSVGAWHEQAQWRLGIPKEEYVKYAENFAPRHGCVDAWLNEAKECGVEYICFTSKHHDGFCMWDTKYTDYNIMNSPYGKDMLREVADGCHRLGLGFAIYYSVPDWHYKHSVNLGGDHQLASPNAGDEPNEELYKAYLKNQIRELLTNYGKVDALFWDIPPKNYDPTINAFVRELQPGILINDRGYSEGDYSTPERSVPSGNFTRLTEACQSVGMQSWGYREGEDYFSHRFLMGSMDSIMARGGNYLLNVGPRADGDLPDEAIDTLRAVGRWYQRVAEAYRNTEYLVLPNQPYAVTLREDSLYIHLPANAQSSGISLRPIDILPKSVTVLNTGDALPFAVEYLPIFFDFQKIEERNAFLHVQKIPVNDLCGEVIVLKIEFEKGDGEKIKRILEAEDSFKEVL